MVRTISLDAFHPVDIVIQCFCLHAKTVGNVVFQTLPSLQIGRDGAC